MESAFRFLHTRPISSSRIRRSLIGSRLILVIAPVVILVNQLITDSNNNNRGAFTIYFVINSFLWYSIPSLSLRMREENNTYAANIRR